MTPDVRSFPRKPCAVFCGVPVEHGDTERQAALIPGVRRPSQARLGSIADGRLRIATHPSEDGAPALNSGTLKLLDAAVGGHWYVASR